MHDRADRHVFERHRIARLHVNLFAGDELVARIHALRSEDVSERAVIVLQERDVGGAVRIIFDTVNSADDFSFDALEIDVAQRALVTAAAETNGDAAIVVARARVRLADGEAFSGLPLCRPVRSTLTYCRRPGVMGLYVLSAMTFYLRGPS
jgi:ADP-ribosylglycohydrolase